MNWIKLRSTVNYENTIDFSVRSKSDFDSSFVNEHFYRPELTFFTDYEKSLSIKTISNFTCYEK